MSPKEQSDALRARRNKQLMEEVRLGYNCTPLTMDHYFFPPRPIIKKDERALEILSGKKDSGEAVFLSFPMLTD